MTVALWIIAICEVTRILQNFKQLAMLRHDKDSRENAYSEFVKSLKMTDSEFVKRMLEEFEAQEEDNK